MALNSKTKKKKNLTRLHHPTIPLFTVLFHHIIHTAASPQRPCPATPSQYERYGCLASGSPPSWALAATFMSLGCNICASPPVSTLSQPVRPALHINRRTSAPLGTLYPPFAHRYPVSHVSLSTLATPAPYITSFSPYNKRSCPIAILGRLCGSLQSSELPAVSVSLCSRDFLAVVALCWFATITPHLAAIRSPWQFAVVAHFLL